MIQFTAENENDPWSPPDTWTGTAPNVYFSLEDVSGFPIFNNPPQIAAPVGMHTHLGITNNIN